MRAFVAAALLTAIIVSHAAPAEARSGGSLSAHPVSLGVHIGVITFEHEAAFAVELPFEYTFQAGPGELAIHIGFMMAIEDHFAILLPIGVRYKIRLLASHPLYIWPMFDLGPAFAEVHHRRDDDDWHVLGYLRIGAGLSYLVHPNVELIFQPLGLGAIFGDLGGHDDDADFSYNLLFGANFRF